MKYLTLFSLIAIGYLPSKVIELHMPNSEEEQLKERYLQNWQNEKAQEVLDDDSASYQEKLEAIETLMKNGKFT